MRRISCSAAGTVPAVTVLAATVVSIDAPMFVPLTAPTPTALSVQLLLAIEGAGLNSNSQVLMTPVARLISTCANILPVKSLVRLLYRLTKTPRLQAKIGSCSDGAFKVECKGHSFILWRRAAVQHRQPKQKQERGDLISWWSCLTKKYQTQKTPPIHPRHHSPPGLSFAAISA